MNFRDGKVLKGSNGIFYYKNYELFCRNITIINFIHIINENDRPGCFFTSSILISTKSRR